MNSLGEPDCLEELACVGSCPAMLELLADGGFRPYWNEKNWLCNEAGDVVDVARSRQPGSEVISFIGFALTLLGMDGAGRHGEILPLMAKMLRMPTIGF